MAVNPLLRSNPVRMMGMASGMDTQSIIDATLRMHQFKIDSQMRNKTLIEWKQKYHQDLKDQITTLRNTYLSNLGSKSLMNRNTFNASTATALLGNGDVAKAVSVRSSVGASTGSMTIQSVNTLARGASYTSSGKLSADGNGFTSGTTLGSMSFYDSTSTGMAGSTGSGITFTGHDAAVKGTEGENVRITKAQAEGASWSAGEYASVSVNGNSLRIDFDGTNYTFQATNGDGEVFQKGRVTFTDGEAQFFVAGGGDPEGTYTEPLENNDILGIGRISIRDTKNEEDEFTGELLIEVNDDEGKNVLAERKLNFVRDALVELDDGTNVYLMKDRNDNIANNGNVLSYTGYASFDIRDVATNEVTTINLNDRMSLTEMVNAVNNSGANVTLSYDRMTDTFKFESTQKQTGTEKVGAFELIETGSNNVLSKLFGANAAGVANGVPTLGQMTQSERAHAVINGQNVYSDTNTFEYRGVFITLNETTNDAITVNVERDASEAVKAIVSFIDDYNALIKKLEDMVNSRKGTNERGYTPLTEEEKSGMTEKQIEEWEAIAKKGLMRNDTGLERLVSSLRMSFFEQIEGTGMSASQLGLTTGNYFGGTGGQIIVDQDKLKAALEADPDKVADVFIKIRNNDDGSQTGVGLLYNLNSIMRDYVNETQSNSMISLERSMKEMNERIAKMEERMYAEEDKLYRQFAAMETALSKMQSQGDWFTAMLGG